MGMVIGIRPGKIPLYKELHAHRRPEMDAALKAATSATNRCFILAGLTSGAVKG